jgi:Tfp pilus assembly protein PilP
MKLATGVLILGMGLGTAGAQNPSILDNTKAKLNAVQQQKTADSNAALAASHGQSANAPMPSAAKPAAAPVKPVLVKSAANTVASTQANSQAANKPIGPAVSKQPASTATQKAVPAASKKQTTMVSAAPNPATPKTKKTKTTAMAVRKPTQPKSAVAVEDKKNPVDPKKDAHKTISMAGNRRDPFLSPVVNRSMGGSGCSTGKRCLAVDQIALTGIVKSEAGMIAVVINAMNKAYFLRENDPVFNGYVVKITGDSIVFKETLQDKLGKSFTREVTKKISTPAV